MNKARIVVPKDVLSIFPLYKAIFGRYDIRNVFSSSRKRYHSIMEKYGLRPDSRLVIGQDEAADKLMDLIDAHNDNVKSVYALRNIESLCKL